jgi:hypothetical protein
MHVQVRNGEQAQIARGLSHSDTALVSLGAASAPALDEW